jgi:tetratricopeptide (TPR) repeat protein
LYKADTFLAEKNYTEAISLYDKVLAKQPEKTQALVNKAHALTSVGQHTKALSLVDKELGLHSGFADPWALLEKGTILSNMGQYREALTWVNKALDANPTNNASALILKKEIEAKMK